MEENLIVEFSIFALIGVGFLVRKLGIVSQDGQKCLTNLVVDVILPCNILCAFLSSETNSILSDGIWVLGISTVFHFFCLGYGHLFFRKPPIGERSCLRFATVCSNAGFLGNPVAEGLYGLEGLALANFYLIPMRILMWSSGIAIFSGSRDWKSTAKKVLTHPCIIAVELGILGMLLHVQLPVLLQKPITYLSSCNTATSMLVIGMILARLDLKQFLDKTVLCFSVHRLVILPSLVLLVCSLLPVSETARNICVLLAAMPVAANTSILADKYDQNSLYATKLVIVSTVLSIPTTALWSTILMRL